jgi:hypothetical protein
MMTVNLAREAAALQRLTVPQLRQRYAEVYAETTNAGNRAWLVKRILWRLQALAEGDLSERARQRAQELANDADLRLNPPATLALPIPATPFPTPHPQTDDRLPPPGTILTRPYKGRTLQVQVLTEGFAFEGHVYPSLSAVAKAATGSHCNGFLFFRSALNNQEETP